MKRTHQLFDPNRSVQVYFNQRRREWSVRQHALVVGYAKSLMLRHVTWRVQASGRARVRREGKEHVHAYAKGWITHLSLLDGTEQTVRYNPYELETFVVGNNQPLLTSQFAVFNVTNGKPHTLACGINL